MRTTTRRMLGAAAAAAFLVTSAGTASAHHCYKEQWNAAAYENHLRGNTAWMPLSDMAVEFVLAPMGLAEQCAWAADAAVEDYMAAMGMTQEPLIHSKATIGSGAYYKKGKAPGRIAYLEDADFAVLEGALMTHVEACLGG
jgi:hypothetical protein